MGIYLGLYFASLISALVFFSLSKRKEAKRYESIAIFCMLLMIFFFAFALYTDDPIEELITTIPAFWQFALTSLAGAFTVWRVYLNPLKEKVYAIDNDLTAVKITVDRFEQEVKNSFQKIEQNFQHLETKLEKKPGKNPAA